MMAITTFAPAMNVFAETSRAKEVAGTDNLSGKYDIGVPFERDGVNEGSDWAEGIDKTKALVAANAAKGGSELKTPGDVAKWINADPARALSFMQKLVDGDGQTSYLPSVVCNSS